MNINSITRKNWKGGDLSNNIGFIYDGTRHVFVPQFIDTDTNKDQSDPTSNIWVRYYIFTETNSNEYVISATVLVPPGSDRGVNQDASDILGFTNVYDDGDYTNYTATKIIGYSIFDGNPYDGGTYIMSDGQEDWANSNGHKYIPGEGLTPTGGYVFKSGNGISPIPLTNNGIQPYNYTIHESGPTVKIRGNKDTRDYDGEKYVVSGYSIDISNDPGNAFRDCYNQQEIIISPEPSEMYATNYDENDHDMGPGTYTSNISASDFELLPDDSISLKWRNFTPIFQIERQAILVIEGDISGGNGIGTPVSASKYYDGEELKPVVHAPEGATVTYSLNPSDPNSWQSDPIGITDAGSIYVTARISIPGQDDQYAYYDLQVLPRPIYIVSDSAVKNYDGLPLICDWITIQGNIETSTSRTNGRYSPPEGSRTIENIQLVGDDVIDIQFKGNQTEIGTSSNSFDFTINSTKPENYDIRSSFGILKVNLNTYHIYVCIEGDKKITPYNGEIQSVSGRSIKYIITQLDPDVPIQDVHDLVETDNNGFLKFKDLYNDTSHYKNYSDSYISKYVQFSSPIDKEGHTIDYVEAIEVNEVLYPDEGYEFQDTPGASDTQYWTPAIYTSELSDSYFFNTNSNFSDATIHFIVLPNQLKIEPLETIVNLSGHTGEYDFNMMLSLGLFIEYNPVWWSIIGCDYYFDNDLYQEEFIQYLEEDYYDPETGNNITLYNPQIKACTVKRTDDWNREDPDTWEDSVDKWYMELDEKLDKFHNTNKNFNIVSFNLQDDSSESREEPDGWLKINPLDIKVNLKGYQYTHIYDGESHELHEFSDIQNDTLVYWKSSCVFYNWQCLSGIWRDFYNANNSQYNWLSVPTDLTSGSHTEINELQRTDEDYWNPIPYTLSENHPDWWDDVVPSEVCFDFPALSGEDYMIAKNFNPNFSHVDGWLLINPFSEEIKVSVTGNTLTSDWTGSEITVTGFESESDNELYLIDYDDYIDFRDGSQPSDVQVSGTDSGAYQMGLSSNDFSNINHNFTTIVFLVNDGWLVINSAGQSSVIEGGDSGIHVFGDFEYSVEDPTVGNATLKRQVQDPNTGQWTEVEHVKLSNVGELMFDFESTSNTPGRINDISHKPGSLQIEPLLLKITSGSRSWPYDGESHDYKEEGIRIDILNSNIPQEDLAHIQTFINNIQYTNWSSITDVGSEENNFTPILSFSNSSPNYIIDGKPSPSIVADPTIQPNVIITTIKGNLYISETVNVVIEGLHDEIVYDGRLHTLTGYKVYDGNHYDPDHPEDNVELDMNISLVYGFEYEDTVDKWRAQDEPYEMGLEDSSFNWPSNVTEHSVVDGWLIIHKRNMILRTGSDSSAWEDDDPIGSAFAYNPHYEAYGLADTDRIEISEDFPKQEGVGSRTNDIEYDIINDFAEETPQSVKDDCYEYVEDWGMLVVNTASNAEMYYRILGIRKEISTPGNENQKVHIEGLKHIDGLVRMVDEDRFYPALHKLVQIPENGEVSGNDVVCIVPLFKHSRKIKEVTWLFENKSTGEKIFSKVHNRIIVPDGDYGGIHGRLQSPGGLADTPVLNVVPKNLTPGYYDVTVNYRMNDKEYSQKFSSVFVIKKQ